MNSLREKMLLCGLSVASIIGGTVSNEMQANDGFRDIIFSSLKREVASLIQNQGSDLFLVPAIVFSAAFGFAQFGREDHESRSVYGIAIAFAGALASLPLIFDEIHEMMPGFNMSSCGTALGRCRGDWADVSVFVPPLLAAAVYLPREIKRLKKELASDAQ